MYPIYPCKHKFKPAIDVSYYVSKYLSNVKPVKNLIVVYSDLFIKIACALFNLKRISKRIYSINDSFHMYKSDIGAPSIAICVEEMSCIGYTNFISIGVAGYFGKKAHFGDIVLCNRALRDEGTSYHYYPGKQKYSYPSIELFKKAKEVFRSNSVSFIECGTWTVDAPYRETFEEFRFYSNKGLSCVDMETSALYTICKLKKLDAISIFIISDIINVDEKKWMSGFYSRYITNSYKHILKNIINL